MVSDSASVVASFVGAAKGQTDGELIGDVDDEDQIYSAGKDQLGNQHLGGTGSVNLEASTPKDVFEFEANQTPENDPEKPQAPEDLEEVVEAGDNQPEVAVSIEKQTAPAEDLSQQVDDEDMKL